MANKIQYVAQWVVSNFEANISTANIYAGLAPEDICHPFVVYNIVSDTSSSDFCREYSAYLVQFSIFDTEQNLATIMGIDSEIRDAFDNVQATDANYEIEMSRYNQSYWIRDEENQGWQGIVEYVIWMH